MLTQDEIDEAVRKFQQELSVTAPRIAEVLSLTSKATCLWTPTQMATATKIKALRAAGLSNTDIIAAFRQGLVEALLS
jgi:lipopolysaccharide export LptBFGC system permease protein LptF